MIYEIDVSKNSRVYKMTSLKENTHKSPLQKLTNYLMEKNEVHAQYSKLE